MGKLFGTDGIRGVANRYPINCDIALKAGQAVGLFAKEKGYSAVVVGKDTRISGDMLESAIAAGITSCGVDALMAGVIPTPGVAFLCRDIKTAGAGIVLSASHNPYQDNGIKIFKHGGVKLSDQEEEQIETDILDNENQPEGDVGRVYHLDNAGDRYAKFLLDTFHLKPNKKLKLVVDCSNGAASQISETVFHPGLFEPHFIFNEPDGKNINENCGSQHTQTLKEQVVERQADIGIAFDGDADRLIAVDETGTEITGDCILAICTKYAKSKGLLEKPILVSTIMSNVGLSECLSHLHVQHLKAGVGDRLVLEEMKKSGAQIGGEDSGHMIFLQYHSTGDGMLSALRLLEVMIETEKSLSELSKIMTVYPQVLKNVEVDASRPDVNAIGPIKETIDQVESELGEKGRVLIRYSGTQPLLRVMVEGPELEKTQEFCDRICQTIEQNI